MERELPDYRLMEVSRSVRADEHAPARARELIRRCFENRLSAEKIEDLELLVTELVTNSIRQGNLSPGSMIQIRGYVHDKRIRVEVKNGDGRPALGRIRMDSRWDTGLGLLLVEQVSSRWGVHLNGHTQFWFELDL